MLRAPLLLLFSFALAGACSEAGTTGSGPLPPQSEPTGTGEATLPDFLVADAESGGPTDPGAETEPGSEGDPATVPDAGADPGSETEPEAGSDTEPEAGTEPEPTPEPEGGGLDLPPCETDADCPAELPQCLINKQCGICYPGTNLCEEQISMLCESPTTGWIVEEDCGALAKVCDENLGVCADPCGGLAKLAGTNAGCDFWAVDLRNAVEGAYDAQSAQFAVIASNTSGEEAEVRVTLPNGDQITRLVAPESLETWKLPATYGLSGTGRGLNAFHLTSNRPIVAYQFNPLSNEAVFSNDASLLLPTSGQGLEYVITTRATETTSFPAYFVVVGLDEAGPTSVTATIAPTASTFPGDDLPALGPSETHTFEVSYGQTVAIEGKGGDLTGTRVVSTAPIMVFAGHTAADTSTVCCADHLEQQLPPIQSWGTEFVIGRSWQRGLEKDYIRVVAAEDGTELAIAPNVTPVVVNLDAGDFHEFKISGDVRIKSDKPIQVVQFLASSQEVGAGDTDICATDAQCGSGHVCEKDPFFGGFCAAIGDPAFILAVPVEQWQTEFVVLTPDSYKKDYLTIVAEQGTSVDIDGMPIPTSSWEQVGSTEYLAFRAAASDGVHVIHATAPVSVTVYGYDDDVSYGYPGAIGLKGSEDD